MRNSVVKLKGPYKARRSEFTDPKDDRDAYICYCVKNTLQVKPGEILNEERVRELMGESTIQVEIKEPGDFVLTIAGKKEWDRLFSGA